MHVCYTVGAKVLYDDYIRNNSNPAKREGGTVWKTLHAVRQYCESINYQGTLENGKVVLGIYPIILTQPFEESVIKKGKFFVLRCGAKLLSRVVGK